MKRKSIILALVLTFALVLGTFQAVFAGYDGIETVPTLTNEVDAEAVAVQLYDETQAGGYKLIRTAQLKKWIDKKKDIVIVDTMPEAWFAQRHIPGAINSFAVLANGSEGEYKASQKADLIKKVKKACGYKKVKMFWNAKSKKWTTKKPSSKYWKKCTKKSDANYGKKTKVVKKPVKDKIIVCYCGFVKCTRSDVAAKYLVEKGYTKVYRHPGGISAWKDAGYPIEGTDSE